MRYIAIGSQKKKKKKGKALNQLPCQPEREGMTALTLELR